MTTIQQTLLGPNRYYSPYMDQVGDLYAFSTFTFTNGGATGRFGPTSFSSVSSYTSQSWYSTYFSVSSGIQFWYAPVTGNYIIRAAGAAGQNGFYADKCRGIIVESILTLTKGMLYKIIVGQKGIYYSNFGSGGGGGGTFLSEYYNVPIIVAGGGGGCLYTNNTTRINDGVNDSVAPNSEGQSSTSGASSTHSGGTGFGGSGGSGGTGGIGSSWGSGGGGFFRNGTAASQASGYGYSGLGFSFVGGGNGGDTATSAVGGFGGGAGTHGNTGGGGGGGGYSGGGGSGFSFNGDNNFKTWGGGGGSYSQSAITVIGYNTGHGYLTITKSAYTYRYIRWIITDLKNFSTANSVQVSEFVLRYDGANISMSGSTVTNPGGNNPGFEGPSNLKDGSTSTKLLDFNIKSSPFTSTIIFDMGSQVTFNEYYWATANDAEERDPKSWTISGSNDGTTYTTLHTVTGFTATSARQTNQTVQSF